MVTQCCNAGSAIDGNSEWCTGCGKEIRKGVQWVMGYNNPNMYRCRYPVYSRTKRFKNYILDLKKPLIFCNFEPIMNAFGLIEFHWGNKGSKTRKYFFNKACVLFFIIRGLEIELEIRTLKDGDRVQHQLAEMNGLLSG